MVTGTVFTAGEVVFTGFYGDYRSIGTQHKCSMKTTRLHIGGDLSLLYTEIAVQKYDGIDSIHGQRNPHRERGLAGMGNGCFAEFCRCVPLCLCELRYSSSKDISFHRFPGDKVAGKECIFKIRRDMPLL